MKILVTGSSGFIGSHLIKELKRRNIPFTTLSLRGLSKKYPEHKRLIQSHLLNTDVVIHLAALAHQKGKINADLNLFSRINTDKTEFLAKEALKAGVKRFVFLSSIAVYGILDSQKALDENTNCKPKNAYGISKFSAEKRLNLLSRNYSMKIYIIRPPIVYGPKDNGNFLRLLQIIKFCYLLPFRALKNKRSLIFIGNLVDALITVALSQNVRPGVYLVSDNESLAVNDLIHKISSAMNKKIILFFVPVVVLNFISRFIFKHKEFKKITGNLEINSSKFKINFNWKATYTFDAALKKTINWFSKNG